MCRPERHRGRARLRHEIPAARGRLRKDAGDGRRRQDRAQRIDRSVNGREKARASMSAHFAKARLHAGHTIRTGGNDLMSNEKRPFRADHVGSLLRPRRSKRRAPNATRRDYGDATESGRGSRDRARDPQAGRDRPEKRSPTANSAAPSGITIFCGAWTASKSYVGERKIKFQGQQPQADDVARDRQARRASGPSDGRAFQVSCRRRRSRRRR